jgi:hypothetical protein
MGHLGELVFRRKGDDRDVIVHLPFIDHLAVLEIHAVELIWVVVLLQDQVAIFVVEHDLLRRKQLSAGGLDL